MKNLMKNVALIAIAFIAFSCSKEENRDLTPVSIAQIAKATPELSSFVEALTITGLASTFDSAGDYTVFAPDDTAFAALLSNYNQPNLAGLEATYPGLLANVLKYHVVSSRVLSTSLTNGMSVSTLLTGQNFTVNISSTGDVSLTDASSGTSNVIARDIRCTNGLIHRIDAVLVPNLN